MKSSYNPCMVENKELLVEIKPSESIPIGFWILGTKKLRIETCSIRETLATDQGEEPSGTESYMDFAIRVDAELPEDQLDLQSQDCSEQREQPHAHRRPFIEVSGNLDDDGTFFLFCIIIFLNRYNPKGIDYTIHVAPYLKVNQTDYLTGRYAALPQIISES
jgi:hypothetical protein